MTYLEKILEEHRSKANEDSRSFKSLYEEAVVEKPTKGFINALNGQRKGEIAVIAEVKRKSPSKGNLVSELNPSQWILEIFAMHELWVLMQSF